MLMAALPVSRPWSHYRRWQRCQRKGWDTPAGGRGEGTGLELEEVRLGAPEEERAHELDRQGLDSAGGGADQRIAADNDFERIHNTSHDRGLRGQKG